MKSQRQPVAASSRRQKTGESRYRIAEDNTITLRCRRRFFFMRDADPYSAEPRSAGSMRRLGEVGLSFARSLVAHERGVQRIREFN